MWKIHRFPSVSRVNILYYWLATVLLNSGEKLIWTSNIFWPRIKGLNSSWGQPLPSGCSTGCLSPRIRPTENKVLCAARQSVFDIAMIWTISAFFFSSCTKSSSCPASQEEARCHLAGTCLGDQGQSVPGSVLMTHCLLRAPVLCLPFVLSQRKVIIAFISLHIEISVPPSPTYGGDIFSLKILQVGRNEGMLCVRVTDLHEINP